MTDTVFDSTLAAKAYRESGITATSLGTFPTAMVLTTFAVVASTMEIVSSFTLAVQTWEPSAVTATCAGPSPVSTMDFRLRFAVSTMANFPPVLPSPGLRDTYKF
ncbi:hypothetical protein D3C76_850870 [compost metagenome]